MGNPFSSSSSKRKVEKDPLFQEIPRAKLKILPDNEMAKIPATGFLEVRLWQGKLVAIKSPSVHDDAEFRKELAALVTLGTHPCIVNLLGVCSDDGPTPKLVTEYIAGGSLDTYLQTTPDDLNWRWVVLAALDIIRGLAHIHGAGLIHRRLQPSNLLVESYSLDEDSVRIKISDFGLSRSPSKKMTKAQETPVYTAPEMFDTKYGHPVDVYSFSIILWQLITRGVPFEDISIFHLKDEVCSGRRPEMSKSTPLVLARLMNRCWDPYPASRPDVKEIEGILRGILPEVGGFPPIQACLAKKR